jgi:hypothetical protein
MDKVLVVKLQSVYGKQVIYPVNAQAKIFASIAGTKTLSSAVITQAAQLGYSIRQEEAFSLEEVLNSEWKRCSRNDS